MMTSIGPMPSGDRARVSVRYRPIAASDTPQALRSIPISVASNACRNCDSKLTIRKRVYCDQCLPHQLAEQRDLVSPKFQAAGRAKIAAMRAAGHNPTTEPEARRRRASASEQRKAGLAWHNDGSLDGIDFRRDILPKLQSLPVRVIALLLNHLEFLAF